MQKLPQPIISGRLVLLLILIGALASACSVGTERLDPDFQKYRQPMGVMLVLTPEVTIMQQLPDGGRLFQTDQSLEARKIAQQSISEQLVHRRFTVKTADTRIMRQPEIQNVVSLFRSVNRSIQLHTFGPQIFPAKLKSFEYSLGSVSDTLKRNGADALVMAIGYQTGNDQPVRNWLSIAVIEPEGRIIWYGVQGNHLKYNLQKPASLTALVADTMTNFWEPGS